MIYAILRPISPNFYMMSNMFPSFPITISLHAINDKKLPLASKLQKMQNFQ